MVETIKEEFEDVNKRIFRTNCKFCHYEIKGSSQSQVEYLLIQHKLAKHSDKVEIREIKK
jgi:hypothetical protein